MQVLCEFYCNKLAPQKRKWLNVNNFANSIVKAAVEFADRVATIFVVPNFAFNRAW